MARGGSAPGPQPIDYELMPYPLTGGVDTKFHGLTLPAPKLQTCENAYVDQTGSIQRRWGTRSFPVLDMGGNTISDFIGASASYQGRVVSFTPSKLYDYSAAASRWVDAGRATSWRLRARTIDAGDITMVQGGAKDMACGQGNYRCYAYEYFETSGANIITRVAVTLVDTTGIRYTTNKVLATSTAAAAKASGVRIVAHGALFYVIYWDVNTAANLKCFIIDTTSASTITSSLAASATTLAANLSPVLGTYAAIDVCDDLWHGPFVAYRSTAVDGGGFKIVKTGFVTTAGALTGTNDITGAGADCSTIAVAAVNLGVNLTLLGVVLSLGTAPNDIFARLVRYNGSAWTTIATSTAMDTALTTAATRAVACIFESATTLRVFYDNDVNVTYPCIRQGTFNTSGTIAPQVERLNRSYLASRPFTGLDGSIYYWVKNEEPTTVQPTLFLMKSDGTLAGVANQGIAVLPALQPFSIGHVPVDSSQKSFSLMCDYLTRIGTDGVGSTEAFRELIVDMSHVDSHVCVEDGTTLIVPSAVLQQYDGVSCTEVGFLTYVDTQNRVDLGAAASSNGAGSLTNAAGTIYSYRVVPEWTNAQGEREQGTDNGPKATAAFALNDDTVTFTIDCVPWTLKQSAKGNTRRQNLVFAVYRTLANPTADSPHYRVGTVQNDPTLDRVTFVDLMSDAVAATQEQLYADAELDAVAPPPGHIVASGNGRVLVAGLADDPCKAVYSKQRGHGQALSFSDILEIQLPSATGAITGAAILNDSVVLFTERASYRVNGSGVNNTGTAGGFTDPILIATNDGAVGPRGVVVTPDGVMFESTARGISLVPLGMGSVQYVGAPLEKLSDSGPCTGAVVVPELQQVRFSFAGTTYVYDYYHRQWYVFGIFSPGPGCVWNGAHVANGAYDDPTIWTDGFDGAAGSDYIMKLVLGFVTAPTARRSDIAVRALGLTGVSLAAHALEVKVRYDLGAFSGDVAAVQVSAAGVLEPKWRLARQRCSSIEVTIRDAIPDPDHPDTDIVEATAGMKLNELVFEMGLVTSHIGRNVAGAGGAQSQ